MTARVLIAEDDPSIAASLEFLMRRSGYETRVASDGAVALELVRAYRPHVLILDVMLPRVSGLEVCREVRGNREWRDTRVLMLSAKGGAGDRAGGVEAGADDYVMKPFSTQDLVRRVKALVPQ